MNGSHHPTFATEEEMYHLWHRVALPSRRLRTREGSHVLVVSPGRRNNASGPDFLDAVLIRNGQVLTGAVEMHRQEREWFDHGHHRDPMYDDVILHVIESESPTHSTDLSKFLLSPDDSPDFSPEETGRLRAIPDEIASDDLVRLLAELSWERFLERSRAYLGADEILSEQTLLEPIFDALGYSANRTPMRRTARQMLLSPLPGSPLEILRTTITCARLPGGRGDRLLHRFNVTPPTGHTGATSDVDGRCTHTEPSDSSWNFRVRPPNRPETRLVAGAVLVDRLFGRDGIQRLREGIERGEGAERVRAMLVVRSGGFSFIGRDRAGAILVNVLLPAFLADGIRSGNSRQVSGACLLYRRFPSLVSNTTLRSFSRRFLDGKPVAGSFLQQGVIAYMSRISGR